MSYRVKGSLLEVCDCEILCPCWVGEDPDNGTCKSILAYHVDEGTIDGIDVSGLTLALTVFIPGNVLDGNWRALMFVDERATEKQQKALLAVWSGEKGGAIADFAQLIGEIVSVERAPIRFEVVEGKGIIKIADVAEAELEPFRGPTGEPTRLVESIFSTIPGSPAYVGKATRFRMKVEALGVDLDIAGHNAIQGEFLFEHAA